MRDLLVAVVKTIGGSFGALLMGMAAVKIIAAASGPDGVGLFSILRQTQQVAISFAILNGHSAVVQGIASRRDSDRTVFISVSLWITVLVTLCVASVFLLVPNTIATWTMGTSEAGPALRILGLAILFGAAYTFCAAVLTGHRLIGRSASVQFVNFFVVAALAYPVMVLSPGTTAEGFAWLLVTGSFCAALSAVVLVRNAGLIHLLLRQGLRATLTSAREFLTFSSGMAIAGTVGLIVPLGVRSLVIRELGLGAAGVLDAAWTLSMSYVTLVLMSFSSYYLPALSELQDPQSRRELIGRVLHVVMILMVPLVTAVIVLKPLVVTTLYSAEFSPSIAIMRWMLIGDYFKVMSWVFSFTMLAYSDLKAFVLTEVVWGALTLGGAFLSVRMFQSLETIGITFMILYIGYFAAMLWYVARRHQFVVSVRSFARPLLGFAVVLVASAGTWSDTSVRWPVAIACLSLAVCAAWTMLESSERMWIRSRF